MAIAVSLYGAKLPFNPERDFAPITLIAKVPLALALHIRHQIGQRDVNEAAGGQHQHIRQAVLRRI